MHGCGACPATQALPSGQAAHSVAPAAEKVPGAQVAGGCPAKGHADPAVHGRHEAEPETGE